MQVHGSVEMRSSSLLCASGEIMFGKGGSCLLRREGWKSPYKRKAAIYLLTVIKIGQGGQCKCLVQGNGGD